MSKYRSVITGVILLLLFFMLVNNFSLFQTNSKEIYYSDFLSMVDNGQIEQVTIRGNQIEGNTELNQTFFTYGTNDETLIERLRNQKIEINVQEPTGNPWYLELLLHWAPLLLLLGVWIYFMKKMPGSGKIMSIGRSTAKKYEDTSEKIIFKDVAGIPESKEELTEVVDFLKSPEKFQKLGGKIPKGILMIGSPGTGKTLLAKAVAGEAGVPFFSVSGSDFVEIFVGVGASRVRDLFEEGKKNAPCIIFIDEIDAVGRHRGAGLGSGHDEREQTLNQLLVEMDGFDTSSGVIIMAATNRVDILDPALLRPGRFDRRVHVPLPDITGRLEILKVHAQKIKLNSKVDLNIIARGTPGFSGADLMNLINEAALWAARQDKKEIVLEDLEWARDKIMIGAERKSLIMSDEEKKNTAYHEAGHALVSAYVENADPIHKITIIPRGQALGVTSYLPETDHLSRDKVAVTSQIVIAMGGRVAEEIIFKEQTTGASNDIKKATSLAYNMVCKWGMSEKLGALTIQESDSGNFLAMDYNPSESVSQELQEMVDEEVKGILWQAHKKATEILSEHIEKLHELANLLLDIETVTQKQFLDLVHGEKACSNPT